MIKDIFEDEIFQLKPFSISDIMRFRFGPLPFVAMAAGAGLEAFDEYQAGEATYAESSADRDLNEYNARLADKEAKNIEAVTRFKQNRQAEEASRRISTLEAEAGASGAGIPLLVLGKQASESELENLEIGYEGRMAASRAESEAIMERYKGKLALMRGKQARTAGRIGAASSLLKGFAGMDFGGGGGVPKTPRAESAPGMIREY